MPDTSAGQAVLRESHRRLTRLAAIFLLALVVAASSARAVPLESVQVGETYYLNNVLAENDLVLVREVDRASGRVKVQHLDGAVDWVKPSELLLQSEAEAADTGEAVVAIALLGGALWAILDPEGFEEAMSGADEPQASSSTSTTGQPSAASPAVAVSGVPFAPVVAGTWADEGEEWISWAEGRLANDIGQTVDIESVRTKSVPLYSSEARNVVLAECVQAGRISAYYILAVAGSSERKVLDGTGGSIHQFNRMMGLDIDSADKAESYLKFFTSAIAADHGIFLVLEPGMEGLSEQSLREIGVSPVRVSLMVDGNWRAEADVLYGTHVYSAVFHISRDGNVEMIEDRHKQQLAFDYLVKMDGGRRMYVRSQ